MEHTFLAGERVAAGLYRQIDGQRTVRLYRDDFLPASLDGRVACYERIDDTWEQIRRRPCQVADRSTATSPDQSPRNGTTARM